MIVGVMDYIVSGEEVAVKNKYTWVSLSIYSRWCPGRMEVSLLISSSVCSTAGTTAEESGLLSLSTISRNLRVVAELGEACEHTKRIQSEIRDTNSLILAIPAQLKRMRFVFL